MVGSQCWWVPSASGLPVLLGSQGVTASQGSATKPTQLAQPGAYTFPSPSQSQALSFQKTGQASSLAGLG